MNRTSRVTIIGSGEGGPGVVFPGNKISPSPIFAAQSGELSRLLRPVDTPYYALADADQEVSVGKSLRYRASTLTGSRTVDVSSEGAELGDIIYFQRLDDTRHRLLIRDLDTGAILGWLNRPGDFSIRWDGRPSDGGLGWVSDNAIQPTLVMRPEDFGDEVGGGGDDTDAIQAMFDAIGVSAGIDRTSNRVVRFSQWYNISRTIELRGDDFNGLVIEGEIGLSGGVLGTTLTWIGPEGAELQDGTSITVDSTARTITRASGSWLSAGFTAGMICLINSPLNKRQFRISNVTASTITYEAADTLTNETTAAAQINEMNALFRLVGCHRVTISSLEFRCAAKTLFGIHIWIDQDEPSLANSSGIIVDTCTIFEPKPDMRDALAIAIGARPRSPAVGSQCDTVAVRDCILYGAASLIPIQGAGWGTLDANNTKVFEVENTGFLGFARGIDWERASGNLYTKRCAFESCTLAVYASADVTIINSNAERCEQMLDGTVTAATALIANCEWNTTSGTDLVVIKWAGQLIVEGGTYRNYRNYRQVVGIDTGTETVTYADVGGEASGQIAVGETVYVRATGAMPTGLYPTIAYRILTAGGSGPSAWTATLEDPAYPGVPVNIGSAGAGVYFCTVPKIQMGDFGGPSSVDCSGAFFFGAYDHLPVCNSNPANDLLSPTYAATGPSRVVTSGCYGGLLGTDKLRDVRGSYLQTAPLQPAVIFYADQVVQPFGGALSRASACVKLDALQLAHELGAATVATQNILIPKQTRLVGIVADSQAWAGTGLGVASLNLAWENGGGTVAGDILLTHSVLANVVRGLADGDLGANMQRANAVQGGFLPSAGWSASWSIRVTLTLDVAFSALTGGQSLLYLILERFPTPSDGA